MAPSLLAEDTLLTPLILNGKAKFLHINLRIRDLGPGVQLSGKVLMDWVVCVKKPWDRYPGFLDTPPQYTLPPARRGLQSCE